MLVMDFLQLQLMHFLRVYFFQMQTEIFQEMIQDVVHLIHVLTLFITVILMQNVKLMTSV